MTPADLKVAITGDTARFEAACCDLIDTLVKWARFVDTLGRRRVYRYLRHLRTGQRSPRLKHPPIKRNRTRTHRRRRA